MRHSGHSAAREAGTASRKPAATASSRKDFTAASESSAADFVPIAGSFLSTSAGAVMMWGRGISEFGAVIILAYNPKIVPTLVYERFEGFGLSAAKPVAVIIVLVALVVFVLLRMLLVPRKRGRHS